MDFQSIGKTLATATFDIHIKDPLGMPLYATPKGDDLTTEPNDRPVIWTLVGMESAAFQRGQAALYNWQQRQGRKNAKFADANQKLVETVASGVVGWKNTVFDGADLPFNLDNLILVLKTYPPAMEQANEAIGERGNFYKSA